MRMAKKRDLIPFQAVPLVVVFTFPISNRSLSPVSFDVASRHTGVWQHVIPHRGNSQEEELETSKLSSIFLLTAIFWKCLKCWQVRKRSLIIFKSQSSDARMINVLSPYKFALDSLVDRWGMNSNRLEDCERAKKKKIDEFIIPEISDAEPLPTMTIGLLFLMRWSFLSRWMENVDRFNGGSHFLSFPSRSDRYGNIQYYISGKFHNSKRRVCYFQEATSFSSSGPERWDKGHKRVRFSSAPLLLSIHRNRSEKWVEPLPLRKKRREKMCFDGP